MRFEIGATRALYGYRASDLRYDSAIAYLRSLADDNLNERRKEKLEKIDTCFIVTYSLELGVLVHTLKSISLFRYRNEENFNKRIKLRNKCFLFYF